MSRPWFRFHVSALDKAKIQKLPPSLFKNWVNIICIGTKADLKDGRLPGLEEVSYQLHLSEKKTEQVLCDLNARNLLDKTGDGWFQLHDWNDWQYEADVSTERVKRFRERQKERKGRNIETVSETPPEQSRAETEQKQKQSRPDQTRNGEFADWIASVRERHPNPSQFNVGVQMLTEKSGLDTEQFLEVHRRWCDHWNANENGRFAPKFTDFVLNWESYAKGPPTPPEDDRGIPDWREDGQEVA